MSISVSVNSKLGSDKTLWSWSVSTKNNKFGSTKTKSVTVGALVAVHSALSFIPERMDVIIRTHDKKLAEILSDTSRSTRNPVITKVFAMIRARQGFVRCIFVSPGSMTNEDKRAVKIIQSISGGPSKPKGTARKPANSLLRPSGGKTVKGTVTRRRKAADHLTTGLEDWDDVPGVIGETVQKPVTCESCDAPISPLTNECLCSI